MHSYAFYAFCCTSVFLTIKLTILQVIACIPALMTYLLIKTRNTFCTSSAKFWHVYNIFRIDLWKVRYNFVWDKICSSRLKMRKFYKIPLNVSSKLKQGEDRVRLEICLDLRYVSWEKNPCVRFGLRWQKSQLKSNTHTDTTNMLKKDSPIIASYHLEGCRPYSHYTFLIATGLP